MEVVQFTSLRHNIVSSDFNLVVSISNYLFLKIKLFQRDFFNSFIIIVFILSAGHGCEQEAVSLWQRDLLQPI